MSTPVVQTPFGPLGQAGVPASPVPIMPETTAIDIDPLGYAAALAAPAIEIANILTDNQKAWARWKAYDSNWFKAYAGGAVPWIGTAVAPDSCGGLHIASTGQVALRITRLVTDPSTRRSYPRRPCVPMTIMSVFRFCANDRIQSGATPGVRPAPAESCRGCGSLRILAVAPCRPREAHDRTQHSLPQMRRTQHKDIAIVLRCAAPPTWLDNGRPAIAHGDTPLSRTLRNQWDKG